MANNPELCTRMRYLASVNKYFVKYKWRLLLGILFVTVSNLFAVLPPDIVRDVINAVDGSIHKHAVKTHSGASGLIYSFINAHTGGNILALVAWYGILLLLLALLRGVFMFFMRQTIIVMSRLIEYDQKNEIYDHYQRLHTHFYKTHFTGDLMNRMAEDVSRVRQYTGPAIMYSFNLFVLAVMCIWGMLRVNPMLTLYVVIPLPLLAISIYYVNRLIHSKSEKIQAQLSDLTTTAQESYSGIRVIKSFVQEKNMLGFFHNTSEAYRKSAINLSLTEAVYFPSMNLFIGLSMLSTIFIGGYLAIQGQIDLGNIAQFVMYINLLMFPISAIGMVASMTQRAGASQKRIDEFLHTEPEIVSPDNAVHAILKGDIKFNHVSFVYPHTGIKALRDFTLHIKPAQKIAIIGKTGSGKSTLAHMLLRMYDTQEGAVLMDDIPVYDMDLHDLRRQIAYAPQEAFLFSDTVYNNIKFGRDDATEADIKEAARLADLEKDIVGLSQGYETVIGERGVMLSGGQKQRMVLARALLKNSKVLLLDECLSAVDTQTEKTILNNLRGYLADKTTIVITHRIFTSWTFDQILVLDDGRIAEQGTHEELMRLNSRYAKLYRHQTETEA
jgi:ATP-binding cassette subfamily B protein